MKKFISIAIVFCLLLSQPVLKVFAAGNSFIIHLRIEGISSNILDSQETVSETGNITLKSALQQINTANKSLQIIGLDNNYITSIHGEKSATFGGWDGWNYLVNGEAPPVGIDSCNIKNGDSIVLFYADYPCQLPIIDYSKLNSNGVITFTSRDTMYDTSGNPTTKINPIVNANFVWHYGNTTKSFKTDSNGSVKIDRSILTAGSHIIELSKTKDGTKNTAPVVLRLAPNTTVTVKSTANSQKTTSSSVSSKGNSVKTVSENQAYSAPATGQNSVIALWIVLIISGAMVLFFTKRVKEI
ncbi:MAG: DUF4430 domain-containing protein [Bacillota bacterium]|nr:DUF4430 domain-containing protein [Bacillota bacterium]